MQLQELEHPERQLEKRVKKERQKKKEKLVKGERRREKVSDERENPVFLFGVFTILLQRGSNKNYT